MKKELLLFACIEKNIGDDLFIHCICQRYPQHSFVISKGAAYGSLKTIPNLRFSTMLKYWNFFNAVVGRNGPRRLIKKLGKAFFGIFLGRHKCSVMIVGNAFKNYSYAGPQQIEWLSSRIALSEEFFLISTNFGPYRDERWVSDCAQVFAELTDICFRDQESVRLFSSLKNVRYAPDAIFSMGKQNRACYGGRIVIVSMIDCAFRDRSEKIHQCQIPFEQWIVGLVDRFTEDGLKVVLVNSNVRQDRPASERVYNRVKDPDKVTIIDYDGDIYAILKLYEQAVAVISTRLHTLILSLLYDVPVFPIVYDEKVKGVLNSCAFTEESIPIESIMACDYDRVERQLCNYSYVLPDAIVIEAEKQFEVLDNQLLYGDLA